MVKVAGFFETSVYFCQARHGVTPQAVFFKLKKKNVRSVTISCLRPAIAQSASSVLVTLVSVKQWTAWSLEVEPVGCPETTIRHCVTSVKSEDLKH
jgi:hypothetical protein